MRWSTAILLVMIGALPAPARAQEPDQASRELFQRVVSGYSAHQKAITSVEYHFTFELNGMTRKEIYARKGEKLYQSGALMQANGGIGLAVEVAWDGTLTYQRSWGVHLIRSETKKRWLPGCPSPETELKGSIEPPLGLAPVPMADMSYKFLRAATIRDKDEELIELEFDAPWVPGTMIMRHSPSRGYWPVSILVKRADGTVFQETRLQKTTSVELAGKTLFYPVVITSESHFPQGSNSERITIDEETLHINQPIPDSRFRIEPWPNEEVLDWETKARTLPADRNWSPVGKVEFPWDLLAARMEARKAQGQTVGRAPPTRSPLATTPPTARPAAPPIITPAVAPPMERYTPWLIPAGVALAVIGAILYLRQRRIAS